MSRAVASDLVVKISAMQSKIQKRVSGALSAHGISFTEYLVLRQLALAAGSRMRRIDLAEEVGLSASGVTRLLNPLEKIGLVEKEHNARDARVSLVALSEAGKRVLAEAGVSFEHAAETIFGGIEPRDMKVLVRVVEGLV